MTTTDLIIVGTVVFLITLSTLTFVFFYRKKKRSHKVFSNSVGRTIKPDANDKNGVRKAEIFKNPDKREGRSRLYVFALVVAGILGTLAMRLWSLQLINPEHYIKLAEDNMKAEVSIPATRGRILDRYGRELVGNRPSLSIVAKKSVTANPIVIHMLSLILGIPKGIIRKNILDDTGGAQADRTIASDISMQAVAFIKEHHSLFSEISVVERTVRTYPFGSIAAHVLGYIGPVTEAELVLPHPGISYEGGDLVGKSGAEYAYENSLQGIRGIRTYKVDVSGNPLEVLGEAPPKNGFDVCLTIDIDLQRETDRIIRDVIESSHHRGYPYANAGAIVCIDIEDGGILASTSYPTYYPSEFIDGISTERYAELNHIDASYPFTNRVISGQYPAASTFKAFTALAGLEYGIVESNTHFYCNGFWESYGKEWGQRCWIHPYGHGYLNLEEAINQSCDIYFYNIGDSFWRRWVDPPRAEENENNDAEEGDPADATSPAAVEENPLQERLRSWGFGRTSGVDIGGETAGRVPTPLWKSRAFANMPEEAQWRPGDFTNMCIGQGDLLVTPLQLANAYAGLARRKMIKPHYFHSVLDDKGAPIVQAKVEEMEDQPPINEYHIQRVENGLQRVIWRSGGHFNRIPVSIAGKSGTAEVYAAKADFSWFVAYAPVENPKYCVACVVEQAGDGSSAAILGVQHTLAAIYGVNLGEIVVYQGSRER